MRWTAFDFETSGTLPEYALQPWRVRQGKSWATSLAIATRVEGKFKLTGGLNPTREMMRAFLEDAIATNSRIVGWNVTFDIAWLLAYDLSDLVFKCKWLDGMLLWRHYFIEPEYEITRQNKKSYRLKECVNEFMPYMAGYEADIDFHDESLEARAKLHKYNEKDTVATLLLAEKWWNLLTKRQQNCALIEAVALPHIANANLQGMLVDRLSTLDLQASLKDQAATELAQLAEFGVTETIVRSPTKLSKLMFDDWGLPVYKENTSAKTGKVSRSTDKEVLHELAFIDPRAKQLRSYREALNQCTKFADTVLASVDYNEDGHTHPLAIPFGTYSGRLTYSSKQGKNKDERQIGFALHQEKREAKFRDSVEAPEGYTLMEFDASGQEFRWMAVASGDETMLRLCLPGEDAHSYMASRVSLQDYTQLMEQVKAGNKEAESVRQLGKVANLSLQYRTSAKRLRSVARVQYDIPMELPEAQRIHRTYRVTYPGVVRYWDYQIALTKRQGFVATLAGRRVQVVGNWSGTFGWSMESTSLNYRIQGTGADQKYLALAVISDYIVKYGIEFGWDLHDGIYLYVPTVHVPRAAVEIKYLLDHLPYEKAWGIVPPIPMTWDCKAGGSWGSLKKWKD